MSQNQLPSEDPDQSERLAFKRYRRKHHPKGWRKAVRDMRHRLEYLGFLVLRGLLRLLGLERASRLSGALWHAIAPRTRRHARALKHLRMALPERPQGELETIAREMWKNLGRITGEALLVDKVLAEPDRVQLTTPAVLDRIRQAGGRAVVVSLHYGNWELVSVPTARNGFKLAGVYQRIMNPLIDQAVVKMRSPIYLGGLHSKGTGAAARLMEWVRDGNMAGVLADQRHVRGVEVPFFGHPAPSNTFPAMLARHLNVPLIAARALREDNVRFKIEALEIEVPQTSDKDADIRATTAYIQAQFEAWIRERPDQWMWAHRRWG